MALDAEFLASQIQGIHYGIAILARNTAWQLSDEEAKMFATALVHCADAYSLSVDPRLVALSELVGVCAMIYVPRYFAVSNAAKSREPAEPNETVVGGPSVLRL